MFRYVLTAMIMLAVSFHSADASAKKRYKNKRASRAVASTCSSGVCGATSTEKTVVRTKTVSKGIQAFVELEAADLAARFMVGHIRGAPRGYMVGTGVSGSEARINTCVGCGTVRAHAAVQGKDGRWYHVRAYSR